MDIKDKIANQRKFFDTGKTLDIEYRINLLKRLKQGILSMENEISEALKKDLGKSSFESYMTEIGIVLSEISFMIKHLKKFSKKVKVKTPLAQFHSRSYKLKVPYGLVLIISPWNYPFSLALMP